MGQSGLLLIGLAVAVLPNVVWITMCLTDQFEPSHAERQALRRKIANDDLALLHARREAGDLSDDEFREREAQLLGALEEAGWHDV